MSWMIDHWVELGMCMADIRFEQRRRWVEQQLDALPFLTGAHRRFLSVPLMRNGWHVLVERGDVFPPPGHAGAFAVGPGGVFALVFTDSVPSESALRQIRAHAEEVFTNLVAGRSRYVPHMVEVLLLMPRADDTPAEARYTTADLTSLPQCLFAEPKLSKQGARQIAMTAADRNIRYELISSDSAPVPETSVTEGLFAPSALRDDERTRALGRPFAEWMTFLDPAQLELVHRNFNGPARFSGPAGTGKTVVALHRMARLAKHEPGRLLFTSFVRTLPAYHESGFRRLAPNAGDRAEFIGLHSWTVRFLRERGYEPRLVEGDNAFSRAWRNARNVLGAIEPNPHYWKDEIQRVIKGRGIRKLKEYREIDRTGRERLALDGDRREFIWKHLYEPYQDNLRARREHDFNDVIDMAIAELRAAPSDDPYALVVVDEVQDFTLTELMLAHQIAGGTPNSPLLLVGDGQQQVYPGGWRLSDAGIPIVGRGAVLRINYRNREAVHHYAARMDATNTVDDLDGEPGFVLRDTEVVLPGGTAEYEIVSHNDAHARLVRAVSECPVSRSDTAVITSTNREAEQIRDLLRRSNIPSMPLEYYDGTHRNEVKVGTVHRAKGMDFAAVFHLVEEPAQSLGRLAGGERDRAELTLRQTMVALTRARDYVWIGLMRE
ncbi:UvrD-helicase domain-containing protein [Nocardia sp. BMG51109]|uniref:UvrD-helicase domain-containing protein n=1 Tax=Nocardia sp. BMG51109 TaxID=1056816 RepID=UPI001E39C9A7|nr:UvrD-helicase domain-containing protein [Nocardia sp. BMG51109]